MTNAAVLKMNIAGTTCNDVYSGTNGGFLGPACSGDCTTCQYVEDKAVRPTDHIPVLVTMTIAQ